MITRAELYGGTSATALVDKVLAAFREVPVDQAVAERAEHGLGLVTRYKRDFQGVRGLRLRTLR